MFEVAGCSFLRILQAENKCDLHQKPKEVLKPLPCSKMEGENIVHVLDTVLMPSGYDMYEDYYKSVTATNTMDKLLEMTGACIVVCM